MLVEKVMNRGFFFSLVIGVLMMLVRIWCIIFRVIGLVVLGSRVMNFLLLKWVMVLLLWSCFCSLLVNMCRIWLFIRWLWVLLIFLKLFRLMKVIDRG